MKDLIKSKIFPIVFIAFVTCLIFFKIFTRGLYPIPGDLLVSFYFPWYSGDWDGYNRWTTHKELLNADSIRQIYLWKEFAMNQFQSGNIPLWNPYTFSGQPLAANFQSSVYYPFNLFYFLLDPKNAWILLIIMQPFLGGIFMYLLLSGLKKPQAPSLFGAVVFMFSSYLITWMENANVGNSYVWLPLAFYSVIKYFEKSKFRYLLILVISTALSVLGGHPQTAIYIYVATFLFWIYKTLEQKRMYLSSILVFIFAALSSILVSSIQIIPTAYFYKVSPVSLPFSKEIFDRSIIPYQNLVTFFASDFFGHPANNNFWSFSYGDFTPYFGVIPLIFCLWAAIWLWKNSFVKFAAITSVFFIICAINGPITAFIRVAKIPVIDSTTPSRFISISLFFLVILAAFGLGDFLENIKNIAYQKKFLKFLAIVSIIYILLWVFALTGTKFLMPKETWQINLAVTRRNLILPTLMFLSIFAISFGLIIKSFVRKSGYTIAVFGIFFVTLLGGLYYSNKFLPVAPKSFIYPDHPLFYWLKHSAGLDRFYGGGTAHIDFNFPTHYRVYGAEGYDTLRLGRYAELMASSFSGSVPKTYLRSDGVFPTEENGYRKRLFELLGVKYLLDKEDNPKTGSDWHYERFPNDKVEGFWQYDKFQVYRRVPVLPRVFQTTKYYVAKNDSDIISKIYDPSYDLQRVILETPPNLEISESNEDIIIPKVEKYDPGQVIVSTNSNKNTILFISDAYDKDWNVYIDGKKSQIARADYALRAAGVPGGNHRLVFKYQPKSFELGIWITLSSIVGFVIVSVYFIKKKKF